MKLCLTSKRGAVSLPRRRCSCSHTAAPLDQAIPFDHGSAPGSRAGSAIATPANPHLRRRYRQEAWRGSNRVEQLARSYIMVGEYDQAIDRSDAIALAVGVGRKRKRFLVAPGGIVGKSQRREQGSEVGYRAWGRTTAPQRSRTTDEPSKRHGPSKITYYR